MSGLIGITLHTPIGALIDATHFKRGLIIAGALALAMCALAITQAPTLPVVLSSDMVMAICGAIFAPTVAAITLEITSTPSLAERLGRNAAFDRAGNIFIAILAGWVGWLFSQRAVFYLVPVFAALTSLAALSIPARSIDHKRARGLPGRSNNTDHEQLLGWRVILQFRPLMLLAAANALFHFANAPMLPLLNSKACAGPPRFRDRADLSLHHHRSTDLDSTALLVGSKANELGHKFLLLIGFAALPIRGVLYTISDDVFWLVGVQILDGVAAGTLDVLIPLLVADIMRGTGRYNLSRGFLGTVRGVAGSLSNAAAGFLVVWLGYNPCFLILSIVAGLACLLLTWLPEPSRGVSRQRLS